jgi:ssRNA-specific RNase YbeY (16S rRNA maturation enzyme)
MMNFPEPLSSPESENPDALTFHNPSGFALPLSRDIFEKILNKIEASEKVTFSQVELVFLEEHEIVDINKKHLNRDYVTDIISFRYDDADGNQNIEGTLCCCAPRIAEQSDKR